MHTTPTKNGARTVTGWRLLPALLAIVGLVAAACGDDSSSDSAEEPAVDLMPTPAISFSATGRVDQHFGVLAQWQEVDGSLIPCTVYPLEFAVCQPVWD